MSDQLPVTTHELWIDGRKMTATVKFVGPTTLRVSWTVPATYTSYNGQIVLLSTKTYTSAEFPEDGKRYIASSNWTAPADTVGEAQVVAAAYGYFGDDLSILSVDVSNVDPNTIYYASVHAASNVLQYYTIGVQSYPVESSRFEKNSDTYAGSIPTSSTPPLNPTNGQVYFDPATNMVLVWNTSLGTWIESNEQTVPTGLRAPINTNQVFYNQTDGVLKFFIGGAWVTCNSTNTRIKYGSGYVPLGVVDSQLTDPPSPGDVAFITPAAPIGTTNIPTLNVYTLGQWLLFSPGLLQFETMPSVWTTSIVGDKLFDTVDPVIPVVGDFFYESANHSLLTWDGDKWVKADTEAEGTPTTDKIGIGTDGSYDERLRLMNILKGQMGWPMVCVELAEEQFNIAIDNALDEFRRRADNAYAYRFVPFTVRKGQANYYLNDPRLKTDRIVDVIKLHRISQLGINSLGGTGNLYSQPFVQQFYNGTTVDILSIHLMGNLAETFEKIFAGNLTFTWDEATRQLYILRNVTNTEERIVIECSMERTEQELLVDRWAKQWLQGWAHAELKEMLGMIRSKYSSVAGPNGGLSLNGDMLISEARSDMEELLRQITDYEVGNGGVNFGNTSFFIG